MPTNQSDLIFSSPQIPPQESMLNHHNMFAFEEHIHDQFLEIDLGYTIVYVMPDQAGRHQVRCLLACCPCLYGGIRNAFQLFWSRGIFRTFIVLVSLLDIIVFFVEIGVNQGFSSPSDNPLIGPSICTIQVMQARFSSAIVFHKQIWRLFVPIFLHGGVVHLVVNVYSQLCVGVGDEFRWGSGFMAWVYLFTGVFGNLLSTAGFPAALSVGASGAIMGITGCSAAHTAVTWDHMDPVVRNTQVFAIVISLVLLVALGAALPTRIDNWTHGGGFVSGLFVGLFCFRKYCVSEWARSACVAAGASIATATLALIVQQANNLMDHRHGATMLFVAPAELGIKDVKYIDCALVPDT